MSRFESMRTDPVNWSLGVIYHCKDDPRIVVRNRLPVGWTWNFAHRRVYFAIGIAIAVFLGPMYLAWFAGLRSPAGLAAIVALSLLAILLVASRLARDPEHE